MTDDVEGKARLRLRDHNVDSTFLQLNLERRCAPRSAFFSTFCAEKIATPQYGVGCIFMHMYV